MRLGTGVNTAAIYTRDGRSELLPIEGATDVEWGRRINAYSEAKVTVAARLSRDCWSALGDVHTWAHSLVVHRDGRRVWEGPVVDMELGAEHVTVAARDVSAWLTRRRIRVKRVTATPVSVLTEAASTITAAFALDDPNVVAHVTTAADPSPPLAARDVKPNSGYYYDDLGALVEKGLLWTVVGRRIVLFTADALLGRTDPLMPERDLLVEVGVVESGEALATRATAAAEGVAGSAVPAGVPAGGVDPYYGLHDMLTEAGDEKKQARLEALAEVALRGAYPAPQALTIPQGARLDCDAPLPIDMLIPGVTVPVESHATPRRISATFTLAGVTVKQGQETEEVTIDLGTTG